MSRFRPALAPPEGGTTLTITGKGFVTPVPGLYFEASVDGKLCPSVRVESDSVLICTVPPGSGSRLTVAITPVVDISYGSPRAPVVFDIKLPPLVLPGFAYKGPTIERVVPTELPTSGGRLTLHGASLGVGEVSVRASDGVECTVVSAQADRVAVDDVGPGSGSEKHLTLRNRSGLSKAPFSYAAPVVTELHIDGAPDFPTWTRNESFTINGLNFGTHNTADLLRVTVGGIPASARLVAEHTSLLVRVPPGAGGRALVQVSLDGLSSLTNPETSIPYSRPHVLACTKSGAVQRAKSSIPDSSEVIDIFVQAQLARYYKNGIRQAELDLFGKPFSKESAKQATEIWSVLEPKIRRMQNKVNKDILVNSITKAWQAVKKSRGLGVEEDPRTKKRGIS
ncbi:hypothetical protein KFL_011520020 [Klebsormidium nitens]|uniref:IPT/TIG domain-containing protein n=1 Tax=Klebsormidium nitens TaxID=105231 RepID=A0A1Y1IVD0_KLENI|nr:hypothetical protein KFL_011520020 [Klebsormidium nitens]|eukprot:GAQ92816.1 hypothetical protein KFL_011520020 [Klebsormidium nitens]